NVTAVAPNIDAARELAGSTLDARDVPEHQVKAARPRPVCPRGWQFAADLGPPSASGGVLGVDVEHQEAGGLTGRHTDLGARVRGPERDEPLCILRRALEPTGAGWALEVTARKGRHPLRRQIQCGTEGGPLVRGRQIGVLHGDLKPPSMFTAL